MSNRHGRSRAASENAGVQWPGNRRLGDSWRRLRRGFALRGGGPVSARTARRFPVDLDAWEIDRLVAAGVTAQQAAAYPRRFHQSSLAELVTGFETPSGARFEGVSPEAAARYADRFTGMGVVALAGSGVTPEVANAYADRFDGIDVAVYLCPRPGMGYLEHDGIGPETANRYDARHTAGDVRRLVLGGVDADQAARYRRIPPDGILALVQAGVTPAEADAFDRRCTGQDIALCASLGISSAALAAALAEFDTVRFPPDAVARLLHTGVTAAQAVGWDPRWSGDGVAHLVEAGVDQATAAAYPERFSGWYVACLVRAGVGADAAATRRPDFAAGWPCPNPGAEVHDVALEELGGGKKTLSQTEADQWWRVHRCTVCDQHFLFFAQGFCDADDSQFTQYEWQAMPDAETARFIAANGGRSDADAPGGGQQGSGQEGWWDSKNDWHGPWFNFVEPNWREHRFWYRARPGAREP